MIKSNEKISEPEMDYAEYALHYDNLCDINPAYAELDSYFRFHVAKMKLPDSANVIDLGAGTGNFVCSLLEFHKSANVIHVDCSEEMNAFARKKYKSLGHSVQIVDEYIQYCDFPESSQDLLVCVNVLNSNPPPLPFLKKISLWLKPGGKIFLVDFGRQLKLLDWTWYLLKSSLTNHGLRKTFESIISTRKAFSSNRNGRSDQLSGKLWTHDTEELIDLMKNAGFDIDHAQPCYRNYADLIVGTKNKLLPHQP